MEAEPQDQSGKAGDPPKEDHEGSENVDASQNPERQGPSSASAGPTGAPDDESGDPSQGPSGPPPESIPGDSGETPNPSQN